MKKLGTLLLALGLAVAGAVTPAQALQPPPGVYFQISYYSDSGFNNLIGQYRIYCDWHDASWGGISEYSYQEYGDC
ncbi:MAG TPA: DUF6289 family protein [Allosphingosinicella sp.]|nr:DUF6289 family protein [Allosphingosinicella sp.]